MIFSRSYPFFTAHDDVSAISQMMSLFGSDKMTEVAKKYIFKLISMAKINKYFFRYGRNIVSSHVAKPDELGEICKKLGNRCKPGDRVPTCLVTVESVDLLKSVLELDSSSRITATGALLSPFLM